jgi:hypothetical protein
MAGSLNMGMDPELDPNDTKSLRGQSDVNGNISEEEQGGISACGKEKLDGFVARDDGGRETSGHNVPSPHHKKHEAS